MIAPIPGFPPTFRLPIDPREPDVTRHDPFCLTCIAAPLLLGPCPFCAGPLALDPTHSIERCAPCGYAALTFAVEVAEWWPVARKRCDCASCTPARPGVAR